MKRLKNCCYCISLQIGTMIAGCVDIVGCMVLSSGFGYYAEKNSKSDLGIGVHMSSYTAAGASFLFFFLTFAICCLLIIAAIKRNAWLILPWLILHLMYIIMFVAFSIASMVYEFKHNESMSGIIALCGTITGTAFAVYLWIVVLSYYFELVNG